MNNPKPVATTLSLLMLLILGKTACGQHPPTLQQQISNKFSRFKNSVSDKFNRRIPSYRATDYQADRSLRSAPHQSSDYRQPMPTQQFRQKDYGNQRGNFENPVRNQTDMGDAATPSSVNRTVAYQEPIPDYPGPPGRGQRQYIDDPRGSMIQQPMTQQPTNQQPMVQQPMMSQQSMPPVNSLRQPAQMDPNRSLMDSSNYQRQLRSDAPLQSKPQSMDYYNQTQYRHFSNRISATERAILLEDEMVRLKDDNVSLKAKNKDLEQQLADRNDEIERLQTAVDEAIKQLSKATGIQQQLKARLQQVESDRAQEKEASDKLLDELRKQLDNLLATELIGSN